MGLFLGPFSGHAVGGGGGTGGPGATSPPPGMGDEAGMRVEVDTVNRSPLKLLRTTMNKHKPKFMKIVPPGQQRGVIAPPYAWDARERDDWEYKTAKPKTVREGEFDTPSLVLGGSPTARSSPDPKDALHARIDAIHTQIKQIEAAAKGLVARKHQLLQQGLAGMRLPQAQPGATTAPPTTHFQGIKGGGMVDTPGDVPSEIEPETRAPEAVRQKAISGRLPSWQRRRQASGPVEALVRSKLRILSAAEDYTPYGIQRREGDPGHAKSDTDHDDWKIPDTLGAERLRQRREKLDMPQGLSWRMKSGEARGHGAEIIDLTDQIKQRRLQVDELHQELATLRNQIRQQAHESIGLSNNLYRISLLLK